MVDRNIMVGHFSSQDTHGVGLSFAWFQGRPKPDGGRHGPGALINGISLASVSRPAYRSAQRAGGVAPPSRICACLWPIGNNTVWDYSRDGAALRLAHGATLNFWDVLLLLTKDWARKGGAYGEH